ncbi:hypothetical protein SETIT_5G388300v2 [Setaria italica]|uniref:Uncharacterized protein n=1 Tax=Setaria italica TaxID=4555 RepID=A0A368RDD9_SETIT|nr:hypothetical protein SETIT_5G388300v2 [Setaria italica]
MIDCPLPPQSSKATMSAQPSTLVIDGRTARPVALNISTSDTATPTVVANQHATISRNHAIAIRSSSINTNTSPTTGCPRRRPRSSRRRQHQQNDPQHRRHLRHPARLTFNTLATTKAALAPSARRRQRLPRHQQRPSNNMLHRQQHGQLHASTHMQIFTNM